MLGIWSALKGDTADLGTTTTSIDSPIALKTFEDVAFFNAFRVGDGIDEGGEVSGSEVVFGEVAVEADFAV